MYLSFALKIAFSNFFSLRKKFLSVCGPRILIICLVALNTELVFLEALKKWFCAFKLQNDFFCKKAQTHENLSAALQKTVHFIRKKHFSCTWCFALKIAFSNFFSLRKKFLSVCGPRILIICLVALNTELVFLEALKKWFCAFKLQNDFFCKKAQTHENLSAALQKTVHFIRKKHFSCTWCFALKIAFSNFFSLRKKFLSVCGPRILIICLVALNTELVFLEALKKWFCAFKLQNDFFCKKAQTHENLSAALQKTVHFIRKKHFSCTWALLLKLHLATFSHWERSFWASVGLAFS